MRPPRSLTRWWIQIFFIFTPKIGEDSQFDLYFSNGLKPPTSLRLEDSFLDEVLPLSVRQEALLAQPGDVLKVQSDKGAKPWLVKGRG